MTSLVRSVFLSLVAGAVLATCLSSLKTARANVPHPCILQPDDVPQGYEIDTPYHETTNDFIIARSSNPNLPSVIDRTGRVTGFEVVYSQATLDALISGPLAIQSWVTIFDNPDGASAVLNASASGVVLQAPEMGAESIAWKTTPRFGPGGLGSIVVGYAFRRSPDELGWTELVGISVGSVDGVTDIDTVSDLLAFLRARGCT
jgi:hypothetical protein